MKKIIWLMALAFIFPIAFTACAAEENLDIRYNLAKGPEQQLLPPQEDEQVFEDPGFDEAYNEFKDIVRKRDFEGLVEKFVDENTISNPDPSYPVGADEFVDVWDSGDEIWTVLDELIELGGRFNSETNTFQAPFMFFDCPDELKDESSDYCFVINDKDVNLYEENDLKSKITAKLDYNVIYYVAGQEGKFVEKAGTDLVKIKTLGGVEGYIQKQYMRSLIEWRFELHETEEGWKLKYLIFGKDPSWK